MTTEAYLIAELQDKDKIIADLREYAVGVLGVKIQVMKQEIAALRTEIKQRETVSDELAARAFNLRAELDALRKENDLLKFDNFIKYGTSHPGMYKNEMDCLKEELFAAQQAALSEGVRSGKLEAELAEQKERNKLMKSNMEIVEADLRDELAAIPDIRVREAALVVENMILKAAVANVKKDAERYRFLCHNFESGFDRGKRDKTGWYAWWYNNRGELSGEADNYEDIPDLDDLIDAAIEGERNE